MRAIWSGEIAFGLVTIPSKLYSGTHDLTPRFHLVHKLCGTRVQIVRRCPHCNRDLAWDEIGKTYEVSKGQSARFTKEEIAEAEGQEGKGVIDIVEFVDPAEVDLAFVENSYWVGPSGRSARSFALLRTVLEKSGKVALAKVTIRTRGRLALLRPRDHLFSLDMLRFADELVPARAIDMPGPKAMAAPTDKELKLATTLVDQLSGRFDPEKHPDEYRARVGAMVEEKIAKHETVESAATAPTRGKHAEGAKVIDLSELLARSLQGKKKPGPAKTAAPHPRGTAGHRPKRRAAGA